MSTVAVFFLGASLGTIGGFGLAAILVAGKQADEQLRHLTLIANTRTDDGSRLLGAIEDELDAHLYGVGSGWRPEITFHEQGAK